MVIYSVPSTQRDAANLPHGEFRMTTEYESKELLQDTVSSTEAITVKLSRWLGARKEFLLREFLKGRNLTEDELIKNGVVLRYTDGTEIFKYKDEPLFKVTFQYVTENGQFKYLIRIDKMTRT
jgi:hypothetical protein